MMRNYEMTFRGVKLHSWIVASMAVILSACADNTDIFRPANSQTGQGLTFTIDESNEWFSTDTRSGEETLPSPFDPIVTPISDNEDQPLYLHTYALPTGTLSDISDRQNKSTRGAMVSSIDDSDKIGLIAYQCDNDGTPDFSNPIRTYLEKSGGNWIAADDRLQWKNSSQYEFYAYYPYTSGKDITVTVAEGTAPTITYTNTGNVADDRDLLVARISASETDYKESAIPLAFTHPLATVVFKTAEGFRDCKVKVLTFGNNGNPGLFESSATIDLSTIADSKEYNDANGFANQNILWQTDSKNTNTANFSLDFNQSGEHLTDGDIVGKGLQTIMIIPTENNCGNIQPVVNISLELKDDNGNTYVMATPNNGIEVPYNIKAGYTTTYVISNSKDLSITPGSFQAREKTYVSYAGSDSLAIDVHSTIRIEGEEIPIGWKAELISEDGYVSSESEISLTTVSGGGLYDNGQLILKIAQSPAIVDKNLHFEKLRSNPTRTDYDLSTKGGATSMNTANCYIVNASGSYRFPLVYGNGVKDGEYNQTCGINKSAIKELTQSSETKEETPELTNFVDYMGNPITDERISGADNVILLWHDATLLSSDNPVEGNIDSQIITNLRLEKSESDDTYDYVSFDVSPSETTLQQANAVIAIRDADNKIMWSWHIWITDYNPDEETIECRNTLENGDTYHAFKYPLGYCDGPGIETYLERKFKIKITQDITSQTDMEQSSQIVEVIQQSFERSGHNNVVMYQARRKDPFIASTDEEIELSSEKDLSYLVYGTSKIFVGTGNELTQTSPVVILDEYLKKGYWADGYRFQKENNTADVSESIQNPNIFYWEYDAKNKKDLAWYKKRDKQKYEDGKEHEDYKSDLWNSGLSTYYKKSTTKQNNIKTIYDPCPPGFMVPPTSFWNIWAGDNVREDAIYDHSHIRNSRGVWLWRLGVQNVIDEVTGEEKTVHVSGNEDDSKDRIFLSANGRRQAGNLDRIGLYCMYWDTGAHENGGYRFWVDTTRASSGSNGASAGASILPVKESD